MKSYEARITIHAPREEIWSILTNASAYPSRNTGITKLEGQILVGEKLEIWTTLSPDKAFPAKVASLEPNDRMVWAFSAPLGVVKGERTFTLTETADGVEFHTREVFSGWMSGMITKKIVGPAPACVRGLGRRPQKRAEA
jgi:uncharacterized protein YndB with AHSA1/START domain